MAGPRIQCACDSFSAMRNPGADQNFTDLAAVVQLRLRVAIGLQALQRCSGLLNRRARGSTVATHHFRIRGEIYYHAPLRTESLQVGVLPDAPIHAALVQLRETLRSDRRGWGWKSLTRHHFAHVVQRRDGALKTRTVSVQIRPWAPTACSPISRGVPLKTGRLQVQLLPRGPFLECQPDKRAGPRC